MARGKRCPNCQSVMYAKNERLEPMGTTVWYECRVDVCPYYKRSGYRYGEKEFEGK